MLKPECDDLLMPPSVLGYSSKHFQLRCLQFQPDAEQIILKFWPEHCCANKHAKKISEQLWSTTQTTTLLHTSVSLAQQVENEGEIQMLSESVDTSTRKHGVSACWLYTHVLLVPCPPSEQLCLCCKGTAVQPEEMESYGREKEGLEDYIHSVINSTHHK